MPFVVLVLPDVDGDPSLLTASTVSVNTLIDWQVASIVPTVPLNSIWEELPVQTDLPISIIPNPTAAPVVLPAPLPSLKAAHDAAATQIQHFVRRRRVRRAACCRRCHAKTKRQLTIAEEEVENLQNKLTDEKKKSAALLAQRDNALSAMSQAMHELNHMRRLQVKMAKELKENTANPKPGSSYLNNMSNGCAFEDREKLRTKFLPIRGLSLFGVGVPASCAPL